MKIPVQHVVGLTSIVRERVLPISGEVSAKLNQKVSAGDLIAEARFSRDHIFLDVAKSLGMRPAAAEKMIKCKIGDELPANFEIAAGRGLFGGAIKTPRAGRVVAVGNGQVLLEVGDAKIELRAGIPGTVIEVIPNKGVVIQTTGGLIQGVWGNGRVEAGVLVNLMEKADSVLTAGKLDVSLRGSVILGGMVKDPEALEAAAELPVRGLILSSLFPSLIPKAREMRYPIIVTDGFGGLPMNSAAYKLLSTNAKREVSVNAEVFDRYTGAKPEVIIPLPVSSEAPNVKEVEMIAPGLQVRMRRPPFMGMVGAVASVKPGLTVLPSGLRAHAAEITLENGESVTVPLVNLEVVG